MILGVNSGHSPLRDFSKVDPCKAIFYPLTRGKTLICPVYLIVLPSKVIAEINFSEIQIFIFHSKT